MYKVQRIMNKPILEIKDLHASIGGKEILKGVNLVINEGEVHAIMGPNGAGKSTLSAVLTGNPAYEVTSGEVYLRGQNLLTMEPEMRARAGVFLSFQYPVEIPGSTRNGRTKAKNRSLPKSSFRSCARRNACSNCRTN